MELTVWERFFDLLLERLNYLPRLQALSQESKFELLHEDCFSIHLQKNILSGTVPKGSYLYKGGSVIRYL